MNDYYGLKIENLDVFKYCHDTIAVLEKIKYIRKKFNFSKNIYLYFFNSTSELQSAIEIKLPSWSSAFCLDNNIIIVNPNYWKKIKKDSIDESIIHEFTHIVINNTCSTKCPLWINEGMAQYYSNEYLKFTNMIEAIDIDLDIYSLEYGDGLLYYISAKLISYLIEEFSESEVIKHIKNSKNFEDSKLLCNNFILKYIKDGKI